MLEPKPDGVIAVNPMGETLRKQSDQSTPRIALIDETQRQLWGILISSHRQA